jgi:dienelactone hydrolase
MSHTTASLSFLVLGSLALGCGGERSSSASDAISSPGPAIHFVTGAEVTRVFLPEEVHVRLTGFPPGGLVTLRASMPGYASHASFRADPGGSVDVASQAPEEGTYEGADAGGLFWSMAPTGAPPGSPDDDIDVTVRAEVGGEVAATAILERYTAAPGVVETPVRDDGLYAVLVTPAAPGPHPALITLGGSEGGIDSALRNARIYASLGYTCLATAYFNAPGLPRYLEDLPLEYFGKAIAWMKRRPEVKADAIGILGASRGGELSLVLGATFPDVKAVVASVPSGVVWPGWNPKHPEREASSWTLGGEELRYVSESGDPSFSTDAEGHRVEHDTPIYLGALDAASPAELDAATTRVEKVQGPVLLVASADDQLWPSCRLAGIAMDRLTRLGHAAAFDDDLVCYPAAGHITGLPGMPTTDLAVITVTGGLRLAIGGTPAGAARAAREGFERKRAFLANALR